MKIPLAILFIVLVVFACGCTAPAGITDPAGTPLVPILVGNWTGPMQGYDEGTGFSEYPDLNVLMMITEQHGRLFTGDILFTVNGTTTKSGFAGVVGRDGKSLTLTEKEGGYCTGEILGTDEIELIYMQDGSPYSIAIDRFRRV